MTVVLSPSQPPPPLWTMNVALNRKRSRVALDSDDEDHGRYAHEEAVESVDGAPLLSPIEGLKKTRTQSELDEMDIVPAEKAWQVDVKSILESPTLERPEGSVLLPHNNVAKLERDKSIIVLCVQGNVQLHYDLLCTALPELYGISPSLQAVVLCRDPATHVPSTSSSISLPLIQAVGPDYNHFVRLGLLHPLGGGLCPLDALVVLDAQGRRRLVMPFGWGAGRHAGTAGGKIIRDTFMALLSKCVATIAQER